MKKLVLAVAASALVAAVPAWAEKAPHATEPAQHATEPAHHSDRPHDRGKRDRGKCGAREEGYNAKGTLVAASLTPGTEKDRFDGTLTVDVLRANHRAPEGSQTFTLTDAHIRFGDGVTSTTVGAGDHVALHGKLAVSCGTAPGSPTVTIRNVEIKGTSPGH